ncbi:MAG: hypothetical protein ACM357_01980 [Gemmatimonadota bacterium]
MPIRVRLSALLVLALGVTVLACADRDGIDDRTRDLGAASEGPGMIYVSLSDSASGNPVPRSSLQLLLAADPDESDSTRSMMAAGDSASGNPTPRTLLVTCRDAEGRTIPCEWATAP